MCLATQDTGLVLGLPTPTTVDLVGGGAIDEDNGCQTCGEHRPRHEARAHNDKARIIGLLCRLKYLTVAKF